MDLLFSKVDSPACHTDSRTVDNVVQTAIFFVKFVNGGFYVCLTGHLDRDKEHFKRVLVLICKLFEQQIKHHKITEILLFLQKYIIHYKWLKQVNSEVW